MFDWIATPEGWASLATLSLLEIVLGIDNIVFISLLAGKLPVEQQARARRLGIMVALGTRVLLLLALNWMIQLTEPLFSLFGHDFAGRDLILIVGGLFLLAKGTLEIHSKIQGEEPEEEDVPLKAPKNQFLMVLVQIGLMDLIFSLDSVITAVGMAKDLSIMVLALVLAMGVMLLAAAQVSRYIEKHPTLKMLALSFLLLIGTTLVADGLTFHIPKGYIYFAMAFSLFTEMMNILWRDRKKGQAKMKSA